MSTPRDAALAAHAAGLSVLPPKQDGTKSPDARQWAQYQQQRADERQIADWYSNGRTGVGWVTGAVSGGLEVIDFDDRATWSEYQSLAESAGLAPLLARVAGGYLEHTPNGAHIAYRCTAIEGNAKLAQRADKKTLIETRGEGGYIIVAPSHGGVNLKGPYTLQSGSVSTIQTITPDERKALHDLARVFNEAIKPVESTQRARQASDSTRPGDDYNARATWAEVLEPHGWTRASGRLGVTSWRRPGKDIGISATTNHADSDLLYVFSTSTEFEAERGYSKFSAYALLNHGGDFSAAARELQLQGYGVVAPEITDIDLSGIRAQAVGPVAVKPPPIDGLLRVPGLVGDFADWINATSHKPQPLLALGASIAAMSTVLGRKVRTETGHRPNIYVLGVGETGCGKERARQAIKRLFGELSAGAAIVEQFASDSAVEGVVEATPACLALIDEMGHFLRATASDKAASYQMAIVPTLMRLYSSSGGPYRLKSFAIDRQAKKDQANQRPQIVEQPSLSMYGTTVPGNLYGSLTKAQISDGFLSRLLVFESTDPDPVPVWVPEVDAAPGGLVDGFGFWWRAPINHDPQGDLDYRNPNPVRVVATQAARHVFDDLETTLRARRGVVRASGGDAGPYTRVVATAWKLALVRACGIHVHASPEITEADAQWGSSLAWGLTEAFLARVEGCVAENRVESDLQRVAAIIRQAGTITRRQLVRRTQWIRARDLGEILQALAESGDIAISSEPGTTKPRTVYTWIRQNS